jgi:signal transduction histidine kinase
MFTDFIRTRRDDIISRAQARVATRSSGPLDDELARDIPLFVDQLADALGVDNADGAIVAAATTHGANLLRTGFAIGQVVHDYGDVCQVVTQLAIDANAQIETEEFRRFNHCLDDAIAAAVTGYAKSNETKAHADEVERLGYLAHELRNKINAAMLAFGILQESQQLVGDSAGVLERSLHGLQELITESVMGVRVESGVRRHERFRIRDLLEELQAEGAMAARAKRVSLTVTETDPDVEIDADHALLAGAIMNLLTNAVKFTHPSGHVILRVSTTQGRVTFDVEDECGGLPSTDAEQLFSPWAQRSVDKRGLGLGLPLVRRSVQALGGDVRVTDLPGKGCVFTISLPRQPADAPAESEQVEAASATT